MGLATVALYVRIPAELGARIEERVKRWPGAVWGKRGVKSDVVIAAIRSGLDSLDRDAGDGELSVSKPKKRRSR